MAALSFIHEPIIKANHGGSPCELFVVDEGLVGVAGCQVHRSLGRHSSAKVLCEPVGGGGGSSCVML